jgi:hypothetical protein
MFLSARGDVLVSSSASAPHACMTLASHVTPCSPPFFFYRHRESARARERERCGGWGGMWVDQVEVAIRLPLRTEKHKRRHRSYLYVHVYAYVDMWYACIWSQTNAHIHGTCGAEVSRVTPHHTAYHTAYASRHALRLTPLTHMALL